MMMKKSQTDNRTIQDQLADFTDQVLEGNTNPEQKPFTSDPELSALEKTVLRLKNTVGDDLNDIVVQRMRQNIIMQWKQRESRASVSFWNKVTSALKLPGQKWHSQRYRQRWSLAISLGTFAALALVSIPFLRKVSFYQPAASGQNLNAGVFIAFGTLALLALLFFQRKK